MVRRILMVKIGHDWHKAMKRFNFAYTSSIDQHIVFVI